MWLLSSYDKILALGDQVKVEGVLHEERLAEVIPGLNRGHVKRGEPLKSRPNKTLLEYADQKPLVSLKLSKVFTVRPQMGDWAASTIILLEFRDMEVC